MDLTKGSCSDQEEEEEGRKEGERWTRYEHTQKSILGGGGGRRKEEGGEKRAPNKAWPYKASLINWN